MSKPLCLLAITAFVSLAVKVDGESRIIGGQNAVNGQFPHHVQIRNVKLQDNWWGRPHCGGSIIAERFVLTAGTCVGYHHLPASNLRVIAGEVDLQADATQHLVDEVIMHPKSSILEIDIALLRMAQPFKFSANVRAIQLPTADTPIEGSTLPAKIIGSGQYKRGSETDKENFPPILQWMSTTAVSRSECKRMFESRPRGHFLRDDHICTKDTARTGWCRFDQGSGLITDGAQPVILGIASVRFDGCPSKQAILYTRVFSFLPFIRSAMQQ